jgi:anti-sigma B factor antagonist
MPEASISMDVRQPADGAAVIDIKGQITGFAENVLMDAYTQATKRGVKFVLLNFANLDYMNSSGIGLLVTLLVRTQRKGQELAAFGLSDHYREIFQLTRLDEAITIYNDEASALAGASA